MAKRGLGKGIGSLISDYSIDVDVRKNETSEDQNSDEMIVVMLSMNRIESNPGQPRKHFDEAALKELADSIREQGVLQPILVEETPQTPGLFIIVAGERRFRAAKLAGLTHIPSLIRNFTEEERLEVALIENIQREGLNPIEEAQAFRFLIEQVSLSQDEVAKKLGKSRSAIANSLRLLNLEPDMQKALSDGSMTSGHARAILSVVNPVEREILFRRILKENLSVRQAEMSSKELNKGSRAAGKKVSQKQQTRKSMEILSIEEKFLDTLGTKVAVKGNLQKGRLEIAYYSPEDLERVYQLFGGIKSLFNDD